MPAHTIALPIKISSFEQTIASCSDSTGYKELSVVTDFDFAEENTHIKHRFVVVFQPGNGIPSEKWDIANLEAAIERYNGIQ